MFGAKTQPYFNYESNPVPATLKPNLELISRSFYNSHMRNLDNLNDSQSPLYGLMTNYEKQTFCWIQPTRVKDRTPDHEYDKYLRKINNKTTNLEYAYNIGVGTDCIALYEADNHWYRGIVVSEISDELWNILFIDYGNSQVCSSQQIRKPILDPSCDFYHAPVQAICCRLYNIVPLSPAYVDEIEKYMEAYFIKYTNKFLEVKVRNIRPDYVVDCDIFRPRSKVEGLERLRGRHIGQKLVDAGFAKFVDPEAAFAPKQVDCIDLTV